jgi:hypothetical protein
MTFEQLDRSIDADSDSEDEMAQQAHLYKSRPSISLIDHWCNLTSTVATEANKGKSPADSAATSLAGLQISSPRPVPPTPVEDEESEVEEEDENDPFADRNEVETPAIEKEEPKW